MTPETSSDAGAGGARPATMPPLPPRPTVEDPTWWRLGRVPFIVLLMAAAAADLAIPGAGGLGLGAALGSALAIAALLLLRKDFSTGERCFLIGLAVVNFIALVVSGSGINWAIGFLMPLVVVLIPCKQERLKPGQHFRTWWGFWFARRHAGKDGAAAAGIRKLHGILPMLICILVGCALFITFLTIFATGNPVVQMVWETIVDTWNKLVSYLHISWDFWVHVCYWLLGIAWFGFYTFRRPEALPTAPRPAENKTAPGSTVLPYLPICSLIGIDLAFLIATSTDIAYLWFARVPEGISQTAYLHDGAASITWASILAAGVLVLLFRKNGTARGSIACRIAGYLLVLQTLLLAISVYMRLYYQIGDYGFTVRRIQAAEALLIGMAGLVVLVFYMACSGSFWKYAKVCIGSMLLLYIACGICSPARMAGDLNLRYAPTHPQWSFSFADFNYGRFEVRENLAFACYVQEQAPDDVLKMRIEREACNVRENAMTCGWCGLNLCLLEDIPAAEKVLGAGIEINLTSGGSKEE